MPARYRLPLLTWTLALTIAPTACVLDPKSSGELDDATSSGDSTAATEATAPTIDGDGEASGPDGPPLDCTEDDSCGTPADPQWSNTFSTGDYTWACDVAIDPLTGRVALAWQVDNSTTHPQGWTGILLYDSVGNLLDSVEVDAQIYGAIAFASDGTLRVRGATALGGGEFQEWARALDPNLQPTWTQPYGLQSGWSQCGWGSRGIEVDDNDQLITYEYLCGSGSCGQSTVRRHEANGGVLWVKSTLGNPGFQQPPIALGANQSMFHGAIRAWDDHDEVEVRKLDADGNEVWMTLLPGELDGIWGTADGGALAATRDFYSNGERRVHHLDPDGSYSWVSEPADPAIYRVAAPTDDESGLFVVAESGGLRRTSMDFETVWMAAIEHGTDGAPVMASDIRYGTFAFGGTVSNGTDAVFVSVLTAP